MQYTVNQLYDHLYQKVYDVYDIFKNFFGEEYTDLQYRVNENYFKRITIVNNLRALNLEIATDIDFDTSFEVSSSSLSILENQLANHKADIYVWWPNVIVSNESGRSIPIKDLYAKVTVQLDGRIPYECRGFGLNRATYTKEQFLSDYLHSHVESIPKGSPSSFMAPCLGSGPIGNTIDTLKNDYDEITWMLFCQELAMYVTVESINGGPWKRLENVGTDTLLPSHRGYDHYLDEGIFTAIFSRDTLKQFMEYYLEKGHLSLSYKDGNFYCGMPYYEYIIDVSNAFIDFFNKNLKKGAGLLRLCFSGSKLLHRTIAANGKFYRCKEEQNEIRSFHTEDVNYFRNKRVLTFKGKEILTTITDEDVKSILEDTTVTIILEHKVAMYILHHILRTINYRYKNEYYNNKHRANQDAPSYQGIIYI